MSQVLDYSNGLIDGQAIKNAGYVGAARYIGFPERRKCTTKSELDRFTAAGVGMALVFEGAATDWRGGYGAGVTNGRKARDHANAIGFPADRPIYMAVDQDVVTAAEFVTMIAYLRGASDSLGGAGRTGVYGEADVVDRARYAGVVTWFWQTAAWSHGRRTTAHLFQHVGTVYVSGIACDFNDVLQGDWGQHDAGATMGAVEDLQAKQYKGADGVTRGALDHLAQGVQWANEAVHAANGARDAVLAKLAEQVHVELTATQVADLGVQLAAGLGATLGADIAAAVLAEASRRLAGE